MNALIMHSRIGIVKTPCWERNTCWSESVLGNSTKMAYYTALLGLLLLLGE